MSENKKEYPGSVYLEFLVHQELERLQVKRLEQSFRDGSYYKSSGSESEKLWLKLRKKK